MREIPILFSAPMVRALLDGTKTQTRRVFKQAKGLSLSVGIPDETPGVAELSWLYGDGPGHDVHEEIKRVPCPYGRPGDRLWVRESHYLHGIWSVRKDDDGKRRWTFHQNPDMGAQFTEPNGFIKGRSTTVAGWYRRPSIHMPRWASRITMEVTGVRVERLQDISEADADSEGCERLDAERYDPDQKLCPKCGGTRLHNAIGSGGGVIFDVDCLECDTYVKRYRHLWESINGPESWSANPWVWCVEFRRLP